MRAARFLGNDRIEMADVPLPSPAPGEALLEVAYCGLCGSDKRPYHSGFDLIPGHEVSGIVVDANGCNVAIGTRAVAYLNVFCGQCRYCQRGDTNCCTQSQGLLGWTAPWNGGYAEYMVVPAIDILAVDAEIELDAAVLLLDTIGTAWHGLRLAEVSTASRALVIGCGPLGLGAVAGLRAFGVPEVFGCDLATERLFAAESLGAHSLAPNEVAEIKDLDLVVEAVGSPKTIMQAIRAVSPGGRVVMLGEVWEPWLFEPSVETMLKDYSLIRSWYFPIREYAENQRILLDGKVDPSLLISHIYPLEELPEAFRLFMSGQTRKVLVAA
jgi:2-desacetyl-2-hydroxyethyl bacteriochlorophyllide A dehydrogenase